MDDRPSSPRVALGGILFVPSVLAAGGCAESGHVYMFWACLIVAGFGVVLMRSKGRD